MGERAIKIAQRIKSQLSEVEETNLNMQTKLILLQCQKDCQSLLEELEVETKVPEAKEPTKQIEILIVDDDKDIQRMLGFILKKKNYNVHSATNPIDGLKMLDDFTPDIIMLDLMMPEMTGFEFLDKIAEHPKRNSIKIVVGSSRTYDKDRLAVLEAGANDFIAKPYNLAELSIRLRNLVTNS